MMDTVLPDNKWQTFLVYVNALPSFSEALHSTVTEAFVRHERRCHAKQEKFHLDYQELFLDDVVSLGSIKPNVDKKLNVSNFQ